jgi:acyl-coenzyme A thioesterase 13
MVDTAAPTVITVQDGEFKGWRQFVTPNTFDEMLGPFYFRKDDDGRIRGAFKAEQKHMNAGHRMHGGAMMTFADIALFMLAYEDMEGAHGVTVQLDSTFVDAAYVGDRVEATGEVVRAGRSLVFVRGQLTTEGRILLTFSGVIRKFRPKAD